MKAFNSKAVGGILGVVMGALLTLGVARAEDQKIGFVDMQKALQSVEAGKKAKTQLEHEANSKTKEFQTEEASLQKAAEEFKKKALVMSDEARAKKQGELQERYAKLQQSKMQTQMELQKKEQDLTTPIITRLRSIVGELGKQKGYTIVLEKNENMVLSSPEKDDLTGEVISRYNSGAGKSSS